MCVSSEALFAFTESKNAAMLSGIAAIEITSSAAKKIGESSLFPLLFPTLALSKSGFGSKRHSFLSAGSGQLPASMKFERIIACLSGKCKQLFRKSTRPSGICSCPTRSVHTCFCRSAPPARHRSKGRFLLCAAYPCAAILRAPPRR